MKLKYIYLRLRNLILVKHILFLILHFPEFIEISEEKWKLAEQTRKFNKLRPFEQADYKKKHPNFEPVINTSCNSIK